MKSTIKKTLNIAEKLIIPFTLGILAFAANNAANKIAKSQSNLAQAQLELNKSANGADYGKQGGLKKVTLIA